MATRKTAFAAVAALAIVGMFGLSAWSQQAGQSSHVELNQAKDMAALIQDGQLNLRDATAIAEKHLHGTALQVKCEMEMSSSDAMNHGKSYGAEAKKEGSSQTRLLYEVSCFTKDKVETVYVDGRSKKVLENRPEP